MIDRPERELPDALRNFLANPIIEMNPMADLLAVMDDLNLQMAADAPSADAGDTPDEPSASDEADYVTLRLPRDAFERLFGELDDFEEYTQTVAPEPDDYQQTTDDESDLELIEKVETNG